MLVSVIVPCRNEAHGIDGFLASIQSQHLDGHSIEILIADGASDDGTREKLALWAARDSRITVLQNPRKIVSTGLNAAIRSAAGDIVVRMDVHTRYEADYIARCVEVLEETSATCVGGSWCPKGSGLIGRAIATAFASGFGSGGAKSRSLQYSGPVDTVYLGAWRRIDLIRLGGFDEHLVRNQDDELNLRITRGGGKVWQSERIRSSYTPRASFRSLFRQFFQYGYWKVAVIRKHRLPASPRHVVPFAFVALVLTGALLAPVWPLCGILALGAATSYIVVALTCAARCGSFIRAPRETLCIAAAFACMHIGYGLGFACGLLNFAVLRKRPNEYATGLTR